MILNKSVYSILKAFRKRRFFSLPPQLPPGDAELLSPEEKKKFLVLEVSFMVFFFFWNDALFIYLFFGQNKTAPTTSQTYMGYKWASATSVHRGITWKSVGHLRKQTFSRMALSKWQPDTYNIMPIHYWVWCFFGFLFAFHSYYFLTRREWLH